MYTMYTNAVFTDSDVLLCRDICKSAAFTEGKGTKKSTKYRHCDVVLLAVVTGKSPVCTGVTERSVGCIVWELQDEMTCDPSPLHTWGRSISGLPD